MNLSARRSRIAILFAVLLIGMADAQTAFRCDNNGQTIYSDKPCPAGKAVVGTQDSAQQKAVAKEANAQMRKDNAELNKRLSDREKLEAQERAAARKAAAAAKASAKGKASGKVKARSAAKKLKTSKPPRNKKKQGNGDPLISAPR